jgi:hypothetical protein
MSAMSVKGLLREIINSKNRETGSIVPGPKGAAMPPGLVGMHKRMFHFLLIPNLSLD